MHEPTVTILLIEHQYFRAHQTGNEGQSIWNLLATCRAVPPHVQANLSQQVNSELPQKYKAHSTEYILQSDPSSVSLYPSFSLSLSASNSWGAEEFVAEPPKRRGHNVSAAEQHAHGGAEEGVQDGGRRGGGSEEERGQSGGDQEEQAWGQPLEEAERRPPRP